MPEDTEKPTSQTISAGGVVLNREDHVLIVKQRGDTWSLPKGHVEPSEDFLAAARREILEETGLRELVYIAPLGSYTRLKKFSSRYNGPELKTIHMFLFRAQEERLHPHDKDNPEAKWVSKDAVVKFLSYQEDRDFFVGVIYWI